MGATAAADPTITEYPTPTSNSLPYGVTPGPDGNVWFTEANSHNIGRITPIGTITEFPLPTTDTSLTSITSGPDGNLWFTEVGYPSRVGRSTTGGTITEYDIPTDSASPIGITTGPDNNLWFTEQGANKIGKITTDGDITEFSVPTSNSYPGFISAGSDGNLWFTETNANKIGRITTSGTFTEYSIPSSSRFDNPQDITSGPDGNLWFTEPFSNRIIKLTTGGVFTPFNIPTHTSTVQGITAGPDGALWFTDQFANQIGRITTSGTVTQYSAPTSNSGPFLITTGPEGTLWFTEYNGNQIGKLVLASAPAAPTNLAAPSPTTSAPALSWDAVTGATSYNIYRNGSLIDSVTTANTTSYTDYLAPEGNNTYYVTAVNSGGESGHSNGVSVLVDRTAPTIAYTVNPTPNSNGWDNTSTTVTYTCTDNTGGSGIASCSSPQTKSADGTYTLTGTATDNAGNSSSVNVTVNIDSTAPTVANVTLATDPLAVNQTTTLSANVTDNTSGVSKVEDYTGTDPGQGNGTPMTLSNGTATATVGPYSTAGMHTYFVRSEDNAGNWSSPMSVILDVYNPAGGYAAGHGSVVPNGSTSNTNPSDVLPTETGNNLKAKFDFTVKYVNSTDTTPTGTSTFSWGSTCNKPQANCFVVTTDTTVNPAIGSLAWLIDPGDNTATFQGTASVSQGSTNLSTNYPVRISVTGTTTTSPGHYLLKVYSVGANPDTASPLYQASGDLSGGSVVLHG